MMDLLIKRLILFLFIVGCVPTDPIQEAQELIEDYDRVTAKQFLVDSILLVDNEWKTYNFYLDNFGLAPLESKEDIEKLDIFVVPVLDLSKEVLDYDYSQNIIQYLRPLSPDWYENYKSFVFYENHLLGVLEANKKPKQSWRAYGVGTFEEEQTYLTKIISNYRDRFFYCQTIGAFCYIDNNELFVCMIQLNRSDSFKKFIEGYFTLKELRGRIEKREKYLSGEPGLTSNEKELLTAYLHQANELEAQAIENRDTVLMKSAIALYSDIEELDPSRSATYVSKAQLQCKLGNYDEAIGTFKELIEIKPNYAEAFSSIGFIYEVTGDRELAASAYSKAIAIYQQKLEDTNSPEIRNMHLTNIVFLYLLQDKKELAIETYKKLSKENDSSVFMHELIDDILNNFQKEEFLMNYRKIE